MIDSPYFIKHNGKLDPVVARDIDLETGDIPQWSDENQHLSKSDISQTESKVIIDNKLEVTGDTTIQGNLDLDTGDLTITGDGNITITGAGDLTINDGDLRIKGNIYQEGESYETHAEQLYTTKDHIILREGAVTGLFEDEHSGIIVNKYDGENNIHLCVNNKGYAQVGETDDDGNPYEVVYEYEFTDTGIFKRDDKYWDSDDKNTDEFNTEHEFYIPAEAYDIEISDTSDPDYEPPSQDETPVLEAAGSLASLYGDFEITYRFTEASNIGFYFDFENSTANYTYIPANLEAGTSAYYTLSGTAKWIDVDDNMIKLNRVEKRDGQIYLNSTIEADEETMLYNGVEIRNALAKRLFKESAYDSLINDGTVFLSTVEYRNNIYWTTWSDGVSDTLDGSTMLYHMVTPEISQFLGEAVEVTVKYKLKESSLQRLLTIEPNPKPNSLLYYDEVSKQARTLQLPESETIPLVPVLENGKITYRKYKQDTNVSFDVSVSQIAFDAAHPIDEVYTQYPWQKSPEEVYNRNGVHSIWERIKDYDGAFFRAEGGLADPFQTDKETGIVYKVIESPLVWLNTNYHIQMDPPTHKQVQGNFTNAVGYNIKNVHILEIRDADNGEYEVRTEDNRTQIIPGTETIYNYNVPVGTVEQIVNRRTDWTVEIHDDFSTDTTNGSAIISTASAANPSTAQHAVRITPVIGSNQSTSLSESGIYSVLNNRTQLMYDKNVNMGHLEGLFTKWKAETKELDIPYANSPNQDDDGYGNPIVFSIANTANPTDAQIIEKVEKLAEQDSYNVVFKDGHSTHYVGTTVYYVVQQGLRATTGGQIRNVFDHWTAATIKHKYYTFPETDEYVFVYGNVTGTEPLDSQIVTRVDIDPLANTDYTLYTFKNGSSVWYAYNSNWIYKKDKATGVNQQLWEDWTLRDKVYWPKETIDTDLYIPNEYITEDEDGNQTRDFILSIASAAAPTEAQELSEVIFDLSEEAFNVKYKRQHEEFNSGTIYKKVIEVLKNGVANRDVSVNYTNFPVNVWTQVYYNKNKLWGTINCVKLQWKNNPYNYFDPVEEITVQKDSYEPNQKMFYNGFEVQSVRDTGEGQWAIRYYNDEEAKYEIFVIANDVTQFEIEDETGEIYKPTLQAVWYNCHKETVPIKFYKCPEWGVVSGRTNITAYYLYCHNNTNYYYTGPEPDPNYFTTLAESGTTPPWYLSYAAFDIPNSNGYYGLMRVDGHIYTNNNDPFATVWYVAAKLYGTYGSIKARDEYIEEHEEDNIIMLPPLTGRDGNDYIASTTSVAAPNIDQQVEYVRLAHNWSNQGYLYMKLKNGYDWRFAISALGYDRNLTSWSLLSVFFNWPEVYEDIDYYYPPEVDWRGDEYIASIASSATPTDAQKIIKIDPLEGSTNYNVYFADGHSAVYAQTQAIYDKNLYYTTIYGIVNIYAEMTYDTIKVHYNKAVGDWNISGVPVVYTRYTGAVAGANAYFTYDDDQLTTATLRNNTATMTNGSRTQQLGLSQAWIRSDDHYTMVQREAAPNIKGTYSAKNHGWPISSGATYIAYQVNSQADYEGHTGTYMYAFDASRFNSVYGRRDEIAPKNLTIRIWKRVK